MGKNVEEMKVVKVARENHDTTSLFFTGPDIERFKGREAGQFAAIRVMKDGQWSEPHPFTLSCPPEADLLRMTIKSSGGEFTSAVPEIAPGTPVQLAGPFGQFCHGIEEQQRIVMIAGGVGITPFLSVLRHFKETGAQNDVTLFWANKGFADAFAAEELEELTQGLKLRVVHVLSRVAEEDRRPAPQFEDGRPGSVAHEYGRVSREFFLRHLGDVSGAAFYLCGPPPMQQAVLDELTGCGVEPERVRREAFVFKKP